MDATLIHGDCRAELPALRAEEVRLVYLDPPFFTQKVHRLGSRDRQREYAFDDLWSGQREYAEFLHACLREVWRVLTPDGSVVLHCDRRSSHIARAVLDDVFGAEHFRSEIIWVYRRWSNARRELLPSHQTLYLYGKSDHHVFNPVYGGYSPATNVDQILQRRVRDASGKATYARDADGAVIAADEKRGVPLGDVWDIPYLNPKARERVGYPTQKPILLLERIIRLLSAPGDLVLDPCCGSGTTLVAARLEGRRAIGIDSSEQAIAISRSRLREPVRTESSLLQRGREAYRQLDGSALSVLAELGEGDLIPVQRNRGMDAILRQKYRGRPVALRVQRPHESEQQAAALLARAGASKKCELMILIVTGSVEASPPDASWPDKVFAVASARCQIAKLLETPALAASRASAE
jgi:site-specific DNA-methyltransferase (adenine-specific)